MRKSSYGTINIIETVGLEEFTLSQAVNPKGCASGGKDMDSQGIRQTLL